jgi:hypothetical protein
MLVGVNVDAYTTKTSTTPTKMTTVTKTTQTTTTATSETTETTETSPKNPMKRPRLMLFQFPLNFSDFTMNDFFLQNQVVLPVKIDGLIVNEKFKTVYGEKKKKDFDEYIKKNYPIFVLQDMFKVAKDFGQEERTEISKRLVNIDAAIKETETKISEIASEKNDLSFISRDPFPYIKQPRAHNSQPINSGIVRMKSEPMTFMYKAWTKIQQFCPRLKGMGMEDFQGDSAFTAGLTGEFATYVAALIAENQLTFPNAYKSLAMQRNVISHCANVMNQLKNYTYTKDHKGICCVKFSPPQRKNALTF